ncbi:putative S-adenosylmethionine-dependent methyltransferase [Morus notabilis]|uniref:Putative S-adenosylmethionine-dependent methyltransferase n=1 Tax=Morus notabilis TaxID=981085 RepID=W9QWN6_9ROSA|nr:probable S-adenosylmethionine-dependent methyltransferase At5g37970 [Morus notabilis]EXB45095.1 putative S-adenosylmethionine-dependent methyltransferase [Morus notabilis]
MNGGNGEYSYSQNSVFQRKAIVAVKELINNAIAEKLEVKISSSSNTFRVADLGCATGPNTFLAVENIINAVDNKCKNQETSKTTSPEYQVFFNDVVVNDFNQLFTSLTGDKKYFVAGVPGSFHSRLFPSASLHFVHSSYALHCLSKAPNIEGRIYYSNSRDEVVKSYEAQFADDMDNFLRARAEEIVDGGLMALVFPGRPNGTPHSQVYSNKILQLVESCIIDMAKKGLISNTKVLSDNKMSASYMASLEDVESAVKRNDCFTIEIMENLPQEKAPPKVMASTIRAGMGRFIKELFGEEIVDQLFDLYLKNLEEASSILESLKAVNLFVLLKRKEIGKKNGSAGLAETS